MGLPLVISEYRQKKILKRYQVTPASPALLLAVQTAVYTVYSLASLVPVSYTHLDVYKRQGYHKEFDRFDER